MTFHVAFSYSILMQADASHLSYDIPNVFCRIKSVPTPSSPSGLTNDALGS